MATLMDTLKKNLTGGTPTAAEPQLGQTQRVQTLLEAKQGRQVAGDTGPARSTIAEKSALQQTKAGLADQSLQSRLQFEGIKQEDTQQKAQVAEQQLSLADQAEDYRSAFERQTESLLSDFERDNRQLDDAKSSAKLEQLGFSLRMQDQEYITNLQQVGRLNRLNSKVGFQEEVAKQTLSDLGELFKNDQDFQRFVGMNERDFREQMGQMDISFATEMAESALKAQRTNNLFSGTGTLIQAGASYYANQKPEGTK